MKKICLFLAIVSFTTLFLASCEKTVQLDSLSGTSWRYDFDDKNYQTYDFYADGYCSYILHTEDEGDTSLPFLQWTCSSSGYVKTFAQITNRTWKTGTFNKDKGTLIMDGLKFKLVKY